MISFTLMILAAGYGKRMQHLTALKPKPLLKIYNKELLRYNIDFFINLGCDKIVINTYYLHDQINKFIEEYYSNKNIKLILEPTLLNTGGGIKNALSLLGDKNFLVTNSDILWKKENKKDVLDFINKYQDIRSCKLLLVDGNNFQGLKKSIGDFKLENNLVKRWKKKDPYLYYTGLQIINPSIFNLTDKKIFSINVLWDLLIKNLKLEGRILESKIVHIGDINAFNEIKDD